MYSLRRPSEKVSREFLKAQSGCDLSYAEVGATRDLGRAGAPAGPHGYVLDHSRVRLGTGVEAFARARAALFRWEMFDVGWAELLWPETEIERGAVVGILLGTFGLWSLSAAQIVYTIGGSDESGSLEHYGFAYGTLPGHVARGEERFSVEWSHEDDGVWYDLLAFSRPTALACTVYPYARLLQRRFAASSLRAMTRSVSEN